MNKTISMSIRVSEEELEKLKQAARLEAYPVDHPTGSAGDVVYHADV